jgi:hypothetical protein
MWTLALAVADWALEAGRTDSIVRHWIGGELAKDDAVALLASTAEESTTMTRYQVIRQTASAREVFARLLLVPGGSSPFRRERYGRDLQHLLEVYAPELADALIGTSRKRIRALQRLASTISRSRDASDLESTSQMLTVASEQLTAASARLMDYVKEWLGPVGGG